MLVDIIEPHKIYNLEQRHLDAFPKTHSTHKNEGVRRFGFQIDMWAKEQITEGTIPGQFDPYDFEVDKKFYDVKSYSGKTITLSDNEYRFADKYNVTYVIYEQLITDMHFRFVKMVDFKTLLNDGKIKCSKFNDGWYFYV